MSMLELMKKRRSQYDLGKHLPIKMEQVEQIIKDCLWQAPSAFNMQSARVVLLLNEKHTQLWQLVAQQLCPRVPAPQWPVTAGKIASFSTAYGTILYFEEETVRQQFQEQFPLYKEHFPIWTAQANAMLQFAIWTALAEVGVGANLQHYNPIIDEAVRQQFQISASWKLIAQMPFGEIITPAEDKTHVPLSQRIRVEK